MTLTQVMFPSHISNVEDEMSTLLLLKNKNSCIFCYVNILHKIYFCFSKTITYLLFYYAILLKYTILSEQNIHLQYVEFHYATRRQKKLFRTLGRMKDYIDKPRKRGWELES